jgi:hypothetical protein
MSDQLFRFSVLRGAELAGDLDPIVVARSGPGQPDDRLSAVADETVVWLKTHPALETATAGKMTAALGLDPAAWTPEMTVGLVALVRRQVIGALETAIDGPSLAARRTLVDRTDHLTAAVLLSELGSLHAEAGLQAWIRMHPIQIDVDSLLPANQWRPKRALVRAPAVCDHFVVREQLVGYEMGEIQDIKNYLRGESKDHSLRYLAVNEEELVTESESEVSRTTETATQQRSSLKAASQKTANSTVGLDARVKTEGQYGPTKVSTDVGFQYSSSSSDASQTASEFSSEVLQKSVEEVRERELTRVTRRTRTELEELQAHKVDNTGAGGHLVGIYRWVDSLWKATTYSIGVRLVLEFLIPEPGRAVEMAGKAPAPGAGEAPPPALPDNLFATIDAAGAAKYAALYGVDGIKAPPVDSQVIGVPFGTTEYKDADGERVMAIVVKDVKIPDKYVGKTVFVAVTAMDRADKDHDSNIVIDVAGAKPQKFLDPGGPDNPFLFSGGVGRPNLDLRTLVIRSDSNFGPGATVPVTVYAEDVRGLAGFVEVHCSLSTAALNEWKLETVQKIASGYRSRLADWQSRRLADSFDVPPTPPDPDLDALCRHACISSLLNGWPATTPTRNNPWPVPGALGNKTGELIEFMEQAFEWNNLQYVAYPYYWAEAVRWPALMGYDHADPHVREFVRSGAVRMVVPVRPDLSEAVLFFLATGVPWFAGSAPIPGEPGYIAIADEIRNSRVDGDGEKVVREFRFRLPTSLSILQETGTLPTEGG